MNRCALAVLVLLLTAQNLCAQKIWSILIVTIEERAEQFSFIRSKIQKQIDDLGLNEEIEILSLCDKRGERTTGFKRQQLLEQCSGKYVCYVDDDDDVHDRYVELIYKRLLKGPDCVSFPGVMTVDGKHPRIFYHSALYRTYFEYNQVYYRPPNHVYPIKRSIAIQFKFTDSFVEDTPWALEIANSGLVHREERIHELCYFYLCKTKK